MFTQRTWFSVLQYPFVTVILAIAQSITQAEGTYCLESQDRHFAHVWVRQISHPRKFSVSDNAID